MGERKGRLIGVYSRRPFVLNDQGSVTAMRLEIADSGSDIVKTLEKFCEAG
jgi:hypothetical protein